MKLATELPEPEKLSGADLERLAQEGAQLREAVEKATRSLEWLSGEDLAIVVHSFGVEGRESTRGSKIKHV